MFEPKLINNETDYSIQMDFYEDMTEWAELQAEMDEALLWEL